MQITRGKEQAQGPLCFPDRAPTSLMELEDSVDDLAQHNMLDDVLVQLDSFKRIKLESKLARVPKPIPQQSRDLHGHDEERPRFIMQPYPRDAYGSD